MSRSPSSLLRPALEAAVQVAREGEAAEPATPAPSMLRRYLSFARLPGPALDIARRAVDDDPEFRRRVAEHTSADQVGEAAWVWLSRPEGWEARLDELSRSALDADRAARDDKAERSARRRLAGAEAAARRAELVAESRTRERQGLLAELASERTRREHVEGELAVAAGDASRWREERNAAVRALKQAQAERAAQAAELRTARHQVRMLEAELGQIGAPAETAVDAPSLTGAGRENLAVAVSDAAEATARLRDALATASALLAAAPGAVGRAAPAPPTTSPERARAAPSVTRAPLVLPPAMFEDAPATAEYLCRAHGVVVIVDGYNVSQRAWPELPIAEQRTRLVDALRELHARTGADVEVVFDGAHPDTDASVSRSWARDAVRVRFSPSGVEADDVVLDRAAALPSTRPVVVASSDRYVRDGARGIGANVVGAEQLLTALRR